MPSLNSYRNGGSPSIGTFPSTGARNTWNKSFYWFGWGCGEEGSDGKPGISKGEDGKTGQQGANYPWQWFDSNDPEYEAEVVDSLGRSVELVIKKLEVKRFQLAK